ncbi:MAG: efflux RND transporter periplasmic adaptor subunit [Oscillospiraceae bacterium]|nr:efflux RND transporter periplasmic adaptor subunit [Oscillospiraceae bacterium]
MKAKKMIVPASIIAGIGLVGVTIVMLSRAATAASVSDVTELERKTLRNSISVTGTVESVNQSKVFSNLTYQIESVNVEVGDAVKKGDVLCTLDTTDLQTQILQQQATVSNSDVNTNYTLTDAEKNYREAVEKHQGGTNSQIVAAEQAVENARLSLEKAERDYQSVLDGTISDSESMISSAELSVQNAELSVQNAEISITNMERNLKNAIENLEFYQDSYDTVLKEVGDEDYLSLKEMRRFKEDSFEVYQKALEENKRKGQWLGGDNYVPDNRDAVDKSKRTYDDAVLAYDRAIENMDSANKSKLDNAERAVTSARQSVESAEASLETAEVGLENAKIALQSAKVSLQSAKNGSVNSDKAREDNIAHYKSMLTNSQVAYENAKNNLSLANRDVEAGLSTLKAAAERERTLSGNNNPQVILLESYRSKLSDAVIIAPSDGIVTAVNAEKGSFPQGVLFIIEDTSDLKVTASVSEYDIALLSLNMPVTVSSDSLPGDDTFDGIISKIAPTAIRGMDMTGSGAGSSNFEVEITVLSKSTPLMVGMTAKVSIVIEESENVFAVMYDSISVDEDGNDIVYTAEGTDGGHTARAVIVTLGMETDFEAEIRGDDLKEGMIILTDASTLYDGAPVLLDN